MKMDAYQWILLLLHHVYLSGAWITPPPRDPVLWPMGNTGPSINQQMFGGGFPNLFQQPMTTNPLIFSYNTVAPSPIELFSAIERHISLSDMLGVSTADGGIDFGKSNLTSAASNKSVKTSVLLPQPVKTSASLPQPVEASASFTQPVKASASLPQPVNRISTLNPSSLNSAMLNFDFTKALLSALPFLQTTKTPSSTPKPTTTTAAPTTTTKKPAETQTNAMPTIRSSKLTLAEILIMKAAEDKKSPKKPSTTPLKGEKGCMHKGVFYRPLTEIVRGQTGDWCYGTYCNHEGVLIHWDDHRCASPTTTMTPPTTTPPPSAGCMYRGLWYAPGADIENGQNYETCYGVYCDYNSKVVHWEDVCTATVAPPNTGSYGYDPYNGGHHADPYGSSHYAGSGPYGSGSGSAGLNRMQTAALEMFKK